jgi:hypothetical protein
LRRFLKLATRPKIRVFFLSLTLKTHLKVGTQKLYQAIKIRRRPSRSIKLFRFQNKFYVLLKMISLSRLNVFVTHILMLI